MEGELICYRCGQFNREKVLLMEREGPVTEVASLVEGE